MKNKDKKDKETEKKTIIPVVKESISIDKIKEQTSEVIIQKDVEEFEEVVDVSVEKDEIQIEHIPIGKVVDEYPMVREEDGVTIIPVVKEKLVVTKQLFLEEEIHINRKTSEQIKQVKETLRKDVVNIETKNQ